MDSLVSVSFFVGVFFVEPKKVSPFLGVFLQDAVNLQRGGGPPFRILKI